MPGVPKAACQSDEHGQERRKENPVPMHLGQPWLVPAAPGRAIDLDLAPLLSLPARPTEPASTSQSISGRLSGAGRAGSCCCAPTSPYRVAGAVLKASVLEPSRSRVNVAAAAGRSPERG